MNIDQLDGELLDQAVAHALGHRTVIVEGKCKVRTVGGLTANYAPSTNCALGCKLINQYRVSIRFWGDRVHAYCCGYESVGHTALVASMRVLVKAYGGTRSAIQQ